MIAGAIFRLGWISLCSGEAGWVILGSVDLELGTDPVMPPMLQNPAANCYIMFTFLLFFKYHKDSAQSRFEIRMKTVYTRPCYKYAGKGMCEK